MESSADQPVIVLVAITTCFMKGTELLLSRSPLSAIHWHSILRWPSTSRGTQSDVTSKAVTARGQAVLRTTVSVTRPRSLALFCASVLNARTDLVVR